MSDLLGGWPGGQTPEGLPPVPPLFTKPSVRHRRIAEVRAAIHAELQRQILQVGYETYLEITDDIWLIDSGVDLHILAMAVVDKLDDEV